MHLCYVGIWKRDTGIVCVIHMRHASYQLPYYAEQVFVILVSDYINYN